MAIAFLVAESRLTVFGAETRKPSLVIVDQPEVQKLRYDEVSFLTTHNAMSCRSEGWYFPNQTHSLTKQLNDGVRGLMLDVHMVAGKPYLVHSNAWLGKRALVDGLRDIASFLKKNPKAILTVIFESYASPSVIRAAFQDAGLLEQLYAHKVGQLWPTLETMVKSKRRVVVFTDRGGGAWEGYHNVWSFCQETHFSVKRVEDFSFQKNRGKAENGLMILNHFLTNPVASASLSRRANQSTVLKPRVDKCQEKTGRLPNFVVLDFYEIGSGREIVNQFNRAQAEKQASNAGRRRDR